LNLLGIFRETPRASQAFAVNVFRRSIIIPILLGMPDLPATGIKKARLTKIDKKRQGSRPFIPGCRIISTSSAYGKHLP
jgi:hypothetical protein